MAHNCSFVVRSFCDVGGLCTGHAVFGRRDNGLGSGLVDHGDVGCLGCLRLTSNSAYRGWGFLRGGLLLALVSSVEVAARFLLR